MRLIERLGRLGAAAAGLLPTARSAWHAPYGSGLGGTKGGRSPRQMTEAPYAGPSPRAGSSDISRQVFVIHGRDEVVRKRVFEFLRALDLKPMEWENLVGASGSTAPFLGDVIQRAPDWTQATVVLLTPDDVVSLHPGLRDCADDAAESEQACQPRPNVLIELGMALVAHPMRIIIVEFGSLRPIADLAGRNVIRFDGSGTAMGKLVERLKLAGCAVDDQGADWRDPRRFAGLDVYDREPPNGGAQECKPS